MHTRASVLLVEDEPLTRRHIQRLLQDLFFEVVEASSLETARDRLNRHKLDVVLCDLVLPDGSGLELLSHVQGIAEDTQVVMMTASAEYNSVVTALRCGACDYIEKPITKDRLRCVLSGASERRRVLQERSIRHQRSRVVLVVEDDPLCLRVTSNLIVGLGFMVLQATTCAEAREILESRAIDVVITDQNLPDGCGTDLIATARARDDKLAAIVLTSQEDARTATAALRAGAFDFLTKSAVPEALSNAVLRAFQYRVTLIEKSLLEGEREEYRARLEQLSDSLEMKVVEKTAEIEKLRQFLLSVMESLPVGLVVIDLEGVIVEINGAGCQLARAERQALIDRKIEDVPFLNPMGESLRRAIQTGTSQNLLEAKAIDECGEAVVMGYGVAPVLSRRDGVTTGALAHFADITAKKRAELYLARSDKLVSLGMLAPGMAHDINNPLAICLGFVDLIDLEPGLGSEGRTHLDKVRQSLLRCREIVTSMLSLARSDGGKFVPICLGEVVPGIVGLLQRQFRIDGVEMSTRTAGFSFILGSKTEIEQLLLNLLVNARDACKERCAGRIQITVDGTDEQVRLAIADDGIGMSGAQVERLFTPFYTTKAEGHGTGLGLSICHGIVGRHGASISVASKPGGGTTFTVLFPHAPPSAVLEDAAGERTVARSRPLPPVSVLVVDDEPEMCEFCRIWLTKAGHRVQARGPGKDALEEALRGDYDAVILDLKMPGLDGLTMLRELRRARPSLPVIMMTGSIGAGESAKLPDEGAVAVLRKPFEAAKLLGVLSKLEP